MASELLEHDPAVTPASAPPLNGRAGWRCLPALLVGIAVQAPLLATFAADLWSLPYRRFAPLLVAGAAIVALLRARAIPAAAPSKPGRRITWLIAVLLTGAAVLVRSPEGAAAAFLMALLAAAGGLGGRTLARAVFPAWLCLWLALPLPFGGDEPVAAAVDSAALYEASTVLDLAGERHRVVGSTIEIPGRSFPAAGDVRPVLFGSLAAVALFAAAVGRGPVWSATLLGSTVLWVIVARGVLFAWPVFAWVRDGTEIDAAGWANWAAFAGTLVLALSTDRAFAWLLPFGEPAAWRSIRDVVIGHAGGPEVAPPADDDLRAEPPEAAAAPSRSRGLLALCGFVAAGALWLVPPIHWGGDGKLDRAGDAAGER